MSDTTLAFPRKLAKRFILMYRDLPCLWDTKCVHYKQRAKRQEAIAKLTSLVHEYDPSATPVHVMRKIESLRACARRENKRVRDSLAAGGDVYVPQLWYYDLISFVFGRRAEVKQCPESEEEDETPKDISEDVYEADSYQEISIPAMIDISSSMPRQPQYYEEHKRPGVTDEYDAIGINVAAKLRNLPSNTRIIAEKLINDVLFQAQVNGLTSSTFISTPDPFK
ncbi:uncharacterized protein LOC121737108 [Aricia agestis]|uniref:uncharacterized protein LOC121737108 n=1 Tax=Aricia agestis TaxID=91739 RepID=UPI001C20998A|nr:uncharacterized protein LOC121737108 [Aricia agestis]